MRAFCAGKLGWMETERRFLKSTGNHCALHMEDSGKPANITDSIPLDILVMCSSFLGLLALISLIGNIIIIIAIYKCNVLHKPVFVFAANIACGDILQAILNVPVTATCLVFKPIPFGPVVCSIQTHIAYSTVSTNLCFLSITAVYRMMQACYNSTFTRINSIRWMFPLSVSAWVIPFVLVVVFSGKAKYVPMRYSCYFNNSPVLSILAAVIYAPMCFLFLVSYVKVLVYVRKCRKTTQVEPLTMDEAKRVNKEMMIYKPVVVIFVLFVVTFFIPGVLYHLAIRFGRRHRPMLELTASMLTKTRPMLNLSSIVITSTYFRKVIRESFLFRFNRRT